MQPFNLFSIAFFSAVRNVYQNHIRAAHATLLIFGVAIIYWRVYQFNFIYGWDDQIFVLNYYTQAGLGWRNLCEIWTNFYAGQYAPLNQLYYTLLYSLFKYNPTCFHIVGVFIHITNVFLVYMLIRSILPKLILLPALQTEQISFLTAFLFAILPVNIEPVTWIAASKVTLYTLFYLAALLSYCRYLDTARAKYFYLTLFFFVLSFATKEQAVLMPLCMLLFDYIYGRDFKDKMIWFEKLPLVILTVLFGLISLQSQGLQGGRSFYPVLQRIPLSAYTLSEYFTKCLIPINLSFLYPFPFQNGDKVLWWLWIYAAAIPLMIYCLYKQLKNRWLLFGLLFFFIHIGLVINLVPLARYSVTADRYAYLSTIGTCFIVGYFVVINLHTSRKRLSWLFVFGLYTALLTAYSSSHIRVWTNTYTLKEKLKKTIESRKDYEELKKLK